MRILHHLYNCGVPCEEASVYADYLLDNGWIGDRKWRADPNEPPLHRGRIWTLPPDDEHNGDGFLDWPDEAQGDGSMLDHSPDMDGLGDWGTGEGEGDGTDVDSGQGDGDGNRSSHLGYAPYLDGEGDGSRMNESYTSQPSGIFAL